MMKCTLLILCLILLAGCSSFYYHPDQKTLKQANIYMINGQTLEDQSQYLNALNTYKEAYQRYTLIDQLEGKAHAMLSLTREYYKLGDMRNFNIWRDSVSTLINLKLPKMKDQLNLLDIEISFRSEDYNKVIELSKGYQSKSLLGASEICSYRLLSKAKLNINYSAEKSFLTGQTGKLAKLYKKHKLEEPSVLAFGYYSIGYVYILQSNYKKALNLLSKAYRIDQSEENYSDIADDIYLIGFTYEKLNQPQLARNSYSRALEISKQMDDQEMQDKILSRMKNLTR
jgi:tetratricopeptide (TPR) repeat protein